MAIYDRDFRCTYMGGSMFEKLGWTPDRILGKTLEESFPPELAEKWAARFRAAIAGMPNELSYVSESGRELDIKVVPVHGEDGEVTGVMTVATTPPTRTAPTRSCARPGSASKRSSTTRPP